MPNRLTKGIAEVGRLLFSGGGAAVQVFSGQLSRTNITDTVLFTLPAAFVIDAVLVAGQVGSNAGTTATISVGLVGLDTEFLNGFSVKGAAGVGQYLPSGGFGGPQPAAAPTTVLGIYAETGTASTTGGPWTVTFYGH